MSNKRYLGDGLYAQCDGYHIVLTAEDGVSVLNTVYLDPDVYQALIRFHDSLGAEEPAESDTEQC